MVDIILEEVNWRTASKAQIKRASAAARRDANALDARVLDELTGIYQGAADDIQSTILRYASDDQSLRLEVLRDLLAQINTQLDAMRPARDQLLARGMHDAAMIGASVFDAVLPEADINRIANEAVRWSRSFVANDGLALSDRLWRIDNDAKRQVGDVIHRAILQGHSADRAAEKLLAQNVAITASKALLKDDGNAYAKAMRVCRTEINRAHGEAYMMTGAEHPDFIGWRYLLSPRHPRPDICDLHAKANIYGLGPGVYPSRERCPWPAHPGTLSYTEIVFADEVSDADRRGQHTRLEWLNRQPDDVKEGVLGAKMKVGALHYGVLKENEIVTPWKVLKQRYEGRGIAVDKLEGSISSAPPVVRYEPVGTPVSSALTPRDYKQVTRHVLSVIDSIHGDGQLPGIPVVRSTSQQFLGAYEYYINGRPGDIKLSSHGTAREMTLAHEIGHFIDHQAVQRGQWASETHAAFMAWVGAVQSTTAVKLLREMLAGPGIINDGQHQYTVNRKYLRYLLDTREVWARSYAQYIATKSRDPAMIAQLRDMQQRISTAPIKYQHQWSDDDFEPVLKSMDELFVKLGWMRERR